MRLATGLSFREWAGTLRLRWSMSIGGLWMVLEQLIRNWRISIRLLLSMLRICPLITLALAFQCHRPRGPRTNTSIMLLTTSTSTIFISRPSLSWRSARPTMRRSAESRYLGCIWACNFLPSAGMLKICGWTRSITATKAPQRLGTSFPKVISRSLMRLCWRRQGNVSFWIA